MNLESDGSVKDTRTTLESWPQSGRWETGVDNSSGGGQYTPPDREVQMPSCSVVSRERNKVVQWQDQHQVMQRHDRQRPRSQVKTARREEDGEKYRSDHVSNGGRYSSECRLARRALTRPHTAPMFTLSSSGISLVNIGERPGLVDHMDQ